MINISLNQVIAGATLDFVGYGGIIQSTPTYESVSAEAEVVNWINKELYQYFLTYDSAYRDMLQISLPIFFDKKINRIICRARKEFTNFPKANRFYERLEYFYSITEIVYSPLEIVKVLPEMIQYDTKNIGGLTPIKISVKDKLPVPSKLTKVIFLELLSKTPIEIKTENNNSEELRKRLMDALNPIPLIYQKYLGFGFNIKRSLSNFLDDKLHIYTTEDSGIALDSLNVENSCKDFVDDVFAGKVNYNDTELQLLNTPISRDALYALLEYHKLHYQSDNLVILENEEQLKAKQKKYVSNFAKREYAGNSYIKQRISAIYKFWCKCEWLDNELYEWFMQFNFAIEKDPETKKLEQNIYRTEIISELSKDKAYNFFLYNIQQLNEEKVRETVKHLGLAYLYEKTEKLLINQTVFNALLDLLKTSDIRSKLQWKNRYSKINEKLSIDKDLQPTTELNRFQIICEALIDNFSDKYQNKVKDFIQGCINLVGHRELAFYQSAFELAEKYNIKISLSYPLDNRQMLFEKYKLFNKNYAQIANKDILEKIATDYIETDFPKTISSILNFAHAEKDFTEKYQSKILQQLYSLFGKADKDEQYRIFTYLLSDIATNKQNPFLQSKNDLFNVITGIELEKVQISEISKLGKSIKKCKMEDDTQYLLQQIDNLAKENKENKKITSRKHSIKSIARIAAIIFFAVSLGLNIYYYNHVNNINNSEKEIQSIDIGPKQEITNSIKLYQDTISKLRNLVNITFLNPYPNNFLSQQEVQKLGKKGSSSNSIAIGLGIDSVVSIIFSKNPRDIKAYYQNQTIPYAKLLILANPNCFNPDSILTNNIEYVPSYKPHKN